jgi:hypothetical protein
MHFEDAESSYIIDFMNRRVNTTIVTYDAEDEQYNEIVVVGPIDTFVQSFFSGNSYNIKKKELAFLRHNVNVWYTEDKYGCLDVFGNILDDIARVDKMIVFSMWSDEYRDSFTLDEFNKIKYLSKKLTTYTVPEELDKNQLDELGRVIIKNKYKILNIIYNENKN